MDLSYGEVKQPIGIVIEIVLLGVEVGSRALNPRNLCLVSDLIDSKGSRGKCCDEQSCRQ